MSIECDVNCTCSCITQTQHAKPIENRGRIIQHAVQRKFVKSKFYSYNFLPTLIENFSFPTFVQKHIWNRENPKKVKFGIMHFAARKRSLGQGNMFTGVCLSTGGYLTRCPARPGTPPGADTNPQEQTPPHPPGADTTPQTRYTPRCRHPPGADTPREDPPGVDTPLEQTPPRSRHTLQSRHPPGADPPLRRACWEIWWMRGRYASYWNAILFFQCHQFLSNTIAQHFELSDYQNYWYTI